MRDNKFGFQAILNRFNLLTKGNKKITLKTFDLSDSLIQIYGDRYIQDKPKGKLLELAELNQLSIDNAFHFLRFFKSLKTRIKQSPKIKALVILFL